MYSSCSRTARIRSNIGLTPRDLQEHILERRLFDLDVGYPHAPLAQSEDQCRNLLLRRIDHHGVVLREPEALLPFMKEGGDRVAFALHGETQLRRADPLGEAERRVLGEDPPAVEEDDLVADPRDLVHAVARV